MRTFKHLLNYSFFWKPIKWWFIFHGVEEEKLLIVFSHVDWILFICFFATSFWYYFNPICKAPLLIMINPLRNLFILFPAYFDFPLDMIIYYINNDNLSVHKVKLVWFISVTYTIIDMLFFNLHFFIYSLLH